MKRGGTTWSERVSEARENALRAMRDAGFDVGGAVRVAVDPKLPFMGYSRPQGDGFQVVVSGAAVGSGMLEGLLIHEMSHIYRMQTGHPSHDGRIISDVLEQVGKHRLSEDYRQKIAHEIINHIEDLYADDISLAVMKDRAFVSEDRLVAFLQDWVKDSPVRSQDATRDAWVNASLLVNNARALAQMDRHHIDDLGGRAATANRRFLSRLPPEAAQHFERFCNFLADLPKDLTDAKYRRMLSGYLEDFLKLVEVLQAPFRQVPSEESEETILRREIEEWATDPPMHGGD